MQIALQDVACGGKSHRRHRIELPLAREGTGDDDPQVPTRSTWASRIDPACAWALAAQSAITGAVDTRAPLNALLNSRASSSLRKAGMTCPAFTASTSRRLSCKRGCTFQR